MKRILLYFIFSVSFAHAQRIKDFYLYSASNIVTGKFLITAGSTCGGFTVYRSTDSLNYTQIYDYPQICGNSFNDESKTFSDANPAINQYNYYKLFLQPFEVAYQKIFVGQNAGSNMLAYPNPVYLGDAFISLKLINAGNANVIGYIFNQAARSIQKLETRTNNDIITVNISGLENGVYLAWFTDGNIAYSTKFIIFN